MSTIKNDSSKLQRETSPESSKDSGYASIVSDKLQQMETIEAEIAVKNEQKNEIIMKENAEKVNNYTKKDTFRHLQTLLDRSEVFSELILDRLRKEKEAEAKLQAKKIQKNMKTGDSDDEESVQETEKHDENDDKTLRRSTRSKYSTKSALEKMDYFVEKSQIGKKRKVMAEEKLSEYFDENEIKAKASKYMNQKVPNLKNVKTEKETFCCDLKYFVGGSLRDYQMDGLMWLKAQFEQGVNGILADEMGLGKTVQIIALFCHFYAKKMTGPFLVVAPLSTLPNWVNEFARFAPQIPVVLYHGVKESRGKLFNKICTGSILDGIKVSPVVLTSYEMVLNDRSRLVRLKFRYLVIDEGHRIKNNNCLLKRELQSLNTCNRLLLTGTPLQNNLSELWSLLNFILPDVFTDCNWFESFFDLNAVHEDGGESKIIAKEQEEQIITKLHRILSPFLLRRIKTEVELQLPPKKEVWVYAPMSNLQLDMYKAAVEKCIMSFFGQDTADEKREKEFKVNGKRKSFWRPEMWTQDEDGTRRWNVEEENETPKEILPAELHFSTFRAMMMLLRKICLHPYLLEYPLTNDGEYKIDDDLIRLSGKFAVLDRLLTGLLERKHKILLFSQMCLVLDIIHDLLYYRKISFCRLDGSMGLEARQEQMGIFANDPDVRVFLISTKAGGLGLNLTAADTVIIFDSDWNPQGDLQAQDRCHRIGQTKPVVVYRLICRGTIDEKMVVRATAKRRLEKMVIQKGRFNIAKPTEIGKITPEELLTLLKSQDYNQILETGSIDQKVLSDEALVALLDRTNMVPVGEQHEDEENNEVFKILPSTVDDIDL